MTTEIYTGLIAKTLEYGDVRNKPFRLDDGYNYLADGFDESHVPDLIRILEDDELGDGDLDQPAVWAQTHAWRIVGQLRAQDAIVPLLNLLRYIDERGDDRVGEEVPGILVQIGSDSLQPAADFLADTEKGVWARVGSARIVEEIGKAYPESRPQCVQIATQQLELFADQDEIINTALIDCLAELKAVEAAPVIERAFAAGKVDLSLRGDWEDVQVDMGLLDARITPKRNYIAETLFGGGGLSDSWLDGEDEDEDEDEPGSPGLLIFGLESPVGVDPKKKKRKRKDAQKQRKAQRRKKKK